MVEAPITAAIVAILETEFLIPILLKNNNSTNDDLNTCTIDVRLIKYPRLSNLKDEIKKKQTGYSLHGAQKFTAQNANQNSSLLFFLATDISIIIKTKEISLPNGQEKHKPFNWKL